MIQRTRGGRHASPRLTDTLLQAWVSSLGRGEWQHLDNPELLHACAQQLQFGRRRRRGQTLLRVRNPASTELLSSSHSVVELITDDMPFLVDTLTMALAQAGVTADVIVHPVLRVERDRSGELRALEAIGQQARPGGLHESWQYLRIDRIAAADCPALQQTLQSALTDVRRACADWQSMRAAVLALADQMKPGQGDATHTAPAAQAAATQTLHDLASGGDIQSESRALLHYMAADHFTFLGFRSSRLQRNGSSLALVPEPGSGLGILRGHDRGVRDLNVATQDIRHALRSPGPLLITKANIRSTVHRPGYLDYIGVKRYDEHGRVEGETRIFGLWTSGTYTADLRTVPLLRHKLHNVRAHFPFAPDSHDGKRLTNILETLPRDELFQASIKDLVCAARAVLELQERAQLRLILRSDEFRRFWSCLIYLPRERIDADSRARIENLLREALRGTELDSTLSVGESLLAQLHVVVRGPGVPTRINREVLERRIAVALVSWRDRLRMALRERVDTDRAAWLDRRYAGVFPASYQQDTEGQAAVLDIETLETLSQCPEQMQLWLYRRNAESSTRVHLRILRHGIPLSIAEILPTFEHFGLRVIAERPYELRLSEGATWIQDFDLDRYDNTRIDIDHVGAELISAFRAIRAGELDDDGFNRLLLSAPLAMREVSLLRACCRYLLQTGIPFSQGTMERVLCAYPALARDLWLLFEQRLKPVPTATATNPARITARTAARHRAAATARVVVLERRIRRAIEAVQSQDEDRILRACFAVILATTRTNYFRARAAAIAAVPLALKLDPTRIPGLPQPLPAFEVFVHDVRVEGVHLRRGPIARGGIRWSERPEDFRTEVLGLMKAQNVKNTLIVPVGAKGGFIARRLTGTMSREQRQREVVSAYQAYVRALLDVTDNIVGSQVVAPPMTTRLDDDDPYLVVAADKGTATFSDTANAIASEYDYWLGDAFASGGSAGYDHKRMGITARGAWECVKRHFRELDRDIQREPFSVAGIGDMSGDVFGNGMLLSRHIRLVAAFNHQHIFLDPQPRVDAAFRERRRLYRLPRSGWADYNVSLISRGGGVFERNVKSITLSVEAQQLLQLPQRRATTQDIIRAILCLPVDLIWNGGIGTYVKASDERHGEIGDRANDAVRVDGHQLRALVVGEGGNLGFSQRGRIEYASRGGRINADFIDNSAGVNTSDVEVNVKILLDARHAGAALTRPRRNQVLRAAADEVAQLVLRNNYLQSQAISLLEARAAADLDGHQRLLHWLERRGALNRAVEFLPDDDQISERRRHGRGLTRPELALLVAYGKIELNRELTSCGVADDPYLARELQRYFPAALQRRFPGWIAAHRLRRQIISTATTNSMVHRVGPDFLMRLMDDTGADARSIAVAYTIARDSADLRLYWSEIEALDGRIRTEDQYQSMLATSAYLADLTRWLLLHRHDYPDAGAAVEQLRPALRDLAHLLPGALQGLDREHYLQQRAQILQSGMPAPLASRLGLLMPMRRAPDLIELQRASRRSARVVTTAYFALAAHLGLDWLHRVIDTLPTVGAWQRAAQGRLQQRAFDAHRRVVSAVFNRPESRARTGTTAMQSTPIPSVTLWRETLSELRGSATPDLAALSVTVEALESLAANPPKELVNLL